MAALTAAPPDVCFLDIRMPRLNGFEVLARLPVQPSVVFTTAHDEYALEAFAVNSVDYLLKPVDPGQLERALGRVERLRRRELEAPDLQALLRTLADSLRTSGYRVSRANSLAAGRPRVVHRPRPGDPFLRRQQADLRRLGGEVAQC